MSSERWQLNVRGWPLFAAAAVLPHSHAATQPVVLPEIVVTPGEGALTAPTTEQATKNIQRTPGAVEVVPDTAFKSGPAQTIKDVLGWVPGVIAQSRWGPDARLSIRGSGLSRSFGNRGMNVYMDGIPINTADGLFDVFEIDPTAYRYVEVFKGANALRYGGQLAGWRDQFRHADRPRRRAASRRASMPEVSAMCGARQAPAAARGPADWFVTGLGAAVGRISRSQQGPCERGSARNFGYRISPDAETRFYVNANTWRSRLPGEVTKSAALNFATDRGSRVRRWSRPAAQHRLGASRQQDHGALRPDHGGLRRLRRRSPRGSSDLPVARLPRRRLRRFRARDG